MRALAPAFNKEKRIMPDREGIQSPGKQSYMDAAIPIGVGGGVALGVVFGVVLGKMAFMTIGIAAGLSIGVAIGAALDQRHKQDDL